MGIPAKQISFSSQTQSGVYYILPSDFTIIYTGTGGHFFRLPSYSSSLVIGKIYEIKNLGTGNLTVSTNSALPPNFEYIDGVTTLEVLYPYESLTLQSTQQGWIIL